MTPVLDVETLQRRLSDSLDLLRDTYTPAPDGTGGGWYHELTVPEPGSTATAVGLMAFTEVGHGFNHFDKALAFLADRQARSKNVRIDGGWATKTSMDRPVVEATAWIARFLARGRCAFTKDAPDVERAYRWLIANQNPDGGWGSLYGCPSRVWLTCLALRAVAELNPYAPEVERGVEWLLAHRVSAGTVWGELPGAPPKVTHTALTLLTLDQVYPHWPEEPLRPAAYRWLENELTNSSGHLHAWIETYTVRAAGSAPVWRLALWHYGLPIAMAALLGHPEGAPAAVICDSFTRITGTGIHDSPWNEAAGGGGTSLWSLWWVVEALTEIRRRPLTGPADRIVWGRDAIIVQRHHARGKPLPKLLPQELLPRRRSKVRRFVTGHAAALTLAAVTICGPSGAVLGVWEWKDFWLSLVFPAVLTLVQETRARRTGAAGE